MKFNTTHKINSILKDIGVQANALQPVFPTALPEEYLVAWEKYLTSKIVRDLLTKYERLEAIYYISMGFISFIEGIYSSDDRKISDKSFALYNPTTEYHKLSDWLSRTRLNSNTRLNSHIFDLDYQHVPLINAANNITVVGVIEYKMNGKRKLTPHLIASTAFGKIPELLIESRDYQKTDTVIRSDKEWTPIPNTGVKGLEIKIARAKFNTLLIKYRFTVPIMLFKGSMAESFVIRSLNTKHKGFLSLIR